MKVKKTTVTKKDLQWVTELAFEVGEFLIKKQSKISKLKVHHKEAQGVASEADIGAEKKILSAIKKRYPTHEIEDNGELPVKFVEKQIPVLGSGEIIVD